MMDEVQQKLENFEGGKGMGYRKFFTGFSEGEKRAM